MNAGGQFVSGVAAIRPARPSDAEALAALADDLNREDGEPVGHVTPGTMRRDFLGDDPAGFALVAEAAGALVGYATAHPGYDPTLALRGTYMGDLYVVREARRRGIARALLTAVAVETRRRGGCMVWCTSRPGNAGAEAFYRAIGARSEPLVTWSLHGYALDRHASEPMP